MKDSIRLICLSILLFSAHLVSGKTLKVLFIGDSITDGAWGQPSVWNATSEERSHTDMNHIFGHGYMMICASTLMAEHPGEYECYNRGISGNTLNDLAGRWEKDVIAIAPDIVSILIGTNDIEQYLNQMSSGETKDFDINAWQNTLDSLLIETRKQLPDVKIMLCTPFVAKVGWRGAAENYSLRSLLISQCDEVMKKVAEKHNAKIVPFHDLFSELTLPSPEYWVWDGIHPTPAAHKLMADVWLKASPR